ncbi:MAG: class I SAM-dependent methyltransferase [Halobacteriales archaeon]
MNEDEGPAGEDEDYRAILDRLEKLEDPSRYRWLSGEELRHHLGPAPEGAVADLGSGSGFYTDELAPVIRRAYAVDVLGEMHERYRERGLPDNVEPVTATFRDLPFADGGLDGAVAVMTFHHELHAALEEIARVLRPGGRLVIVDWSATGVGERDPPVEEEYFDPASCQARLLDAGFRIRVARERRETFVVVATRRSP